MDEQTNVLSDDQPEPPTVSDADYEQLYTLLYAYRFGSINFLELLDKIEAILDIHPPQDRRRKPHV